MKKLSLTLLTLTLFATLVLGAGNNWRNERPFTSVAGPNINVWECAIAANGNNLAAAFVRAYTNEVRVIVSQNGGVSWGTEYNPDPGSACYTNFTLLQSNRSVAVTWNGNDILLAYAGFSPTNGSGIHYRRSTNFGASWVDYQAVNISNDPGNDYYPSVAITYASGTILVAWTFQDYSANTSTGWVRRKTTGGWQTSQQVTTTYNTFAGFNMEVKARWYETATTQTFVAWNHPTSDGIYTRRSTNLGAAWQTITLLENPTGTDKYPALDIRNNNNQGWVIWQNSANGVRCKRIGSTGSSTVVPGLAFEPRISIDQSDSLCVTAAKYVNLKYVTYYNQSADGSVWKYSGGLPVQNDPNSPNPYYRHPDISAHWDPANGGTMRYIVWNGVIQSLGHQELWLGVNDLGKPAPPTNFQAVQYCNDLIGYWTELSWLPTFALDDSGYNIYRGTWSGPSSCQNIIKLNGDIYPYTSYTDWTMDCGCYCYEVKSMDLALNEGPPTPNIKVGACASPGEGRAEQEIGQTLGGVQASPYTVRRGGRLVANGKTADTDPSRLAYRLSGMDPQKYYALTLVYAFPGMLGESRVVTAWADSFNLSGPKTLGNGLSWSNHVLPKASYTNGTLNFNVEKVDGPDAVLAYFILWKMPAGYNGGPQCAGAVARNGVQPYLAPPRPNPSTGEVFLGYWLPKAGEATLRVYNTAGQLVRDVDSGQRNAGTHSLIWDGKSASGHKVPNGVYLVRLVSGSVSATQKVTILR